MKLLVSLCCVLFASIHSSIAKEEPNPFDPDSTPAISKEEVTVILVKAQDGDPNAQFRIGKLYEDGEFFRRDMPKAKEWYQKAKKAGHYGATDSLKRLADREIFDAVERGSLADVRDQLDKGISPNAVYDVLGGMPLLEYALMYDNNDEICLLIMERGGKINIRAQDGDPLMDTVVWKKRKKLIVKYFEMEKHPDEDVVLKIVNDKIVEESAVADALLASPFVFNADLLKKAIHYTPRFALKMLQARGKTLFKSQDEKNAVLWNAAMDGELALVTGLIVLGADPRAPGIVHAAAWNVDFSVFDRLYPYAEQVDVRDQSGETILHRACSAKNYDVIQFLIDQGADVNAISTKRRKTPMDCWVTSSRKYRDPADREKIFDALWEAGARRKQDL